MKRTMKLRITHPLRAVLFLLVTFGLTQLSPSIAFGQLSVFYTDFNSGAPPEFSGVTTTEGVQGYAGLGTGLNVFSGDFLYNDSGGFPKGTPGSPTTLTLTGLPPHTSINLSFLLAIIDSWDGSNNENAPDVFSVRVDGNTVFSETFTNVSAFGVTASYPNAGTPAGVTLVQEQQLGFNTLPDFFLDSAYNMGLESAFQNIPHTASTLTIEWFAGGDGWQGAYDDWQPGNDESWAIDNVEVTLNQGVGACTAQVQPPINAHGSSVWTVRRGVVPVKFSLTCDGSPTCDLSPATIVVTRTAGGTQGAINESVYSMAADTGSNFRIDGCQYIYNLESSALGAGTYRVDILINSQVVGSATFQLK